MRGKSVLVTGHTGFKGSWLSLYLHQLGANITGFSLPPTSSPNLFTLANIESLIDHRVGDIRDQVALKKLFQEIQPEVVFHLAAQPLVLTSYENPTETFETNAQGTVHVLEAIRHTPSVKAAVFITSDKCYENNEWCWGYREEDKLGGHDPYSASKAMAELAINSYRRSFFTSNGPSIASARAGNVIGGGDFSTHRLLPDIMKALLENKSIQLRNPNSVRPWLHVLDPLKGYLQLSQKLLEEGKTFAQAWNFGPKDTKLVTAQELVEEAIELWGSGKWHGDRSFSHPHEMNLLRLSWEKASYNLNWRPSFNWKEAVGLTVNWFKALQEGKSMRSVCLEQIHLKEKSCH